MSPLRAVSAAASGMAALGRRYRAARLSREAAEVDMLQDPGERLYAELYLDAISARLPARRLRILDAGCQAGRLAIPLAAAGHEVTGVDISSQWIAACERNAAAAGVTIALRRAPIQEALADFDPGVFDVVLCTELLYACRDFRAIVTGLARALAPDGVAFTSHRTRYYMLATLLRHRRFAEARRVVAAGEGEVFGEYFNWFEEGELAGLYADAGLRVTGFRGIGVVSGVGADALAAVVNPAKIDAGERAVLIAIERAVADTYRSVARYVLVTAERGTAGSPA